MREEAGMLIPRREAIVGALLLAFRSTEASAAARFDSLPQTEWEKDGRIMRLLRELTFIDAKGNSWIVPVNARLDGASIPQLFWSIMGGPFEGKYRRASIVHDYYCSRRNRQWPTVHRMFYEGMIVDEVAVDQAKIMYAAVRVFGPRWDELTVTNNNLPDVTRSLTQKSSLSARYARERELMIKKSVSNAVRRRGGDIEQSDKFTVEARYRGRGDAAKGQLVVVERWNPTESNVQEIVAAAPKASLSQIDSQTWSREILD